MNNTGQESQRRPAPLGIVVQNLFDRRWLIVACLVSGWATGTMIGWILPKKYRSETVIRIEQQKVPEHYVESNVTSDMQQRLQSISEQILSRTRLLALIEKFQLYGGNRAPRNPDALVELMRRDIAIELITPIGRRDQLSAFKVSYSAATPMLAKEVTQELTALFINENLQDRKQLSEDTTSFLQSQLDDARQSLTQQEEKLRQFRTQHSGELPDQLQSNLQILSGLQVQLQAANDALTQAQQRNLYLRSLLSQYQMTRPGTVAELAGSAQTQTLSTQAQLAALRTQLAELQGRYTERYPDILRVKQQIAELEAQQANGSASPAGSAVSPSTEANVSRPSTEESSPVIQLRSELSANEFQIQNEKTRIKRFEEEIGVYQARLNSTPEREQQAAAVTRDYDQSRAYYDALLNKKLQSEMATELEKRRQGEQFQMIDRPNLPSKPYWPNRLAFSFGGLAAGLAVGVALTLLLELLRPRLNQESELGEFIGSGYVLTLPAFETKHELAKAHKRRVVEAIAGGALAVLIPVVTILSHLKQ